jgi:soluble lytic murein transglycosylase-like protein
MISKLGLSTILGQPQSRLNLSPKDGGADFQSLLKEKIEELKPLEILVLQYLSRAVELALSETKPEQEDLLSSFPQSIPLPMKLSAPEIKTVPLQETAVSGENMVSNNLQGKQNFEPIIKEAGKKYGVDPFLIKAVMQVESGGNPMAVSRAGAKGLMQIMPKTAAELGVKNLFDPVENIMGGTRYLRRLMDRYHGNIKLTLALITGGWVIWKTVRRPCPKRRKIISLRLKITIAVL